jgi:hypothetical protein
MLAGRTPTAPEQAYLDAVASLGCIICLLYLHLDSPAEIHHVEGKTDEGCHFLILPLCPPHHRHPGNGKYVSRADGKKLFEETYMPEHDLIIVVRRAVELRGYVTYSGLSGKRWNNQTSGSELHTPDYFSEFD